MTNVLAECIVSEPSWKELAGSIPLCPSLERSGHLAGSISHPRNLVAWWNPNLNGQPCHSRRRNSRFCHSVEFVDDWSIGDLGRDWGLGSLETPGAVGGEMPCAAYTVSELSQGDGAFHAAILISTGALSVSKV